MRKDLERTNKVIAQMKNTNFSSIPVQQNGGGRLKHAIKTKVDTFKGKRDARRGARTKSENFRTDLAYTSAGTVLAGIGKFVVDVLVHKKPVSGIFAKKMDDR